MPHALLLTLYTLKIISVIKGAATERVLKEWIKLLVEAFYDEFDDTTFYGTH